MGTKNSPSFIRIKIKNKNFWLELLTMTFDRTTACKPGLPLCNAFFFTNIKIKHGVCLTDKNLASWHVKKILKKVQVFQKSNKCLPYNIFKIQIFSFFKNVIIKFIF